MFSSIHYTALFFSSSVNGGTEMLKQLIQKGHKNGKKIQ